ncbi:ribosome maturation factor RimM [Lapillicoccus jejuensis]|uniref:Ribosome maturation factor RimM n=1 Tax=Lapillicoccus jejuensis TaxID=402171 RepID=A0A542E3B8_9MICO|nr:ribosome maturation factor RimM [Lapillicoccus jejuensis]TQJ09833.1 16S rRNA processing protein RimM [Lapillicoccus jejuensis]
MDTQLVVARIGKPHALRGEVTVQLHTDDPESRFVPGATFPTQAAAGSGVPRELTLRSARLHQGTWLLAFEEVPDRTGAEGLRGTRLLADAAPAGAGDDADDAGESEEGFYEDELVGLDVLDPAGARLGRVSGLEVGVAQDLLRVTLEGGDRDGAEVLVPFVRAIVPSVDLAARRVVVDAPPGLLELEA